jgi:hypothetical protein
MKKGGSLSLSRKTSARTPFSLSLSLSLSLQSLFIKQAQIEPVYDSTVIENEINDNLTYNSYRKFHHTKKWSKKETIKFYKALSMIGTDFTMIQRLFPNRNRDEVKRKFKREERLNQALIDKLLCKFCETILKSVSIKLSIISSQNGPHGLECIHCQ